jgi:type IV pilus assembly protein PilV
MVEVLVSVVVVSVGILGNAALYFTALQTKRVAISRIQVVSLVNDMADRIRANRTAGIAYQLGDSKVAVIPSVDCVGTSSVDVAPCNPAEMATADLFLWSASVAGTLSGKSTRSIAVDTTTTPTTYTITINWSSPARGAIDLSHSLRLQI